MIDEKQYTVQCMEAEVGSLCGWKEQNYRPTISARERRQKTPTQWMVKHFIPVLHEEDEHP